MNESYLKSALMKELKLQLPGFVALRHEDVRSAGIPDMSLTGGGRTTWWEFKLAAPRFASRGIQELTMLQLAAAGFARYVVWEEKRSVMRTLIVHPKRIGTLMPEDWCTGFDMQFIVDFMRKVQHA